MGVRSSRVEEGRCRCVRTGFGPADGEGAGDRPMPVRLRCVKVMAMNTAEFSSKVFDSLTPDWLDGRKIKALML